MVGRRAGRPIGNLPLLSIKYALERSLSSTTLASSLHHMSFMIPQIRTGRLWQCRVPNARARAVASAAAMLLLGGCASITPHRGFERVETLVRDRTGARVRWDQGGPADSAVADTVRALLAGELTSERAVQVALLRNRDLQALYEDLGIAQSDLVQAGLFRNPVLNIGRIRSGGPSEFGLLVPFIDLFLRPLRQRVAGAAFEAATLRVASGVFARTTDVRSAFYRAQGALQLVELRAGVAAATRASAQSARAISAAGNLQDLDLVTQQAVAEQAQVDLDIAIADANVAREQLVRVLGVTGADTAIRVGNRLPELPARDAPVDSLTTLAMRRRLDLAASVQQVQSAAQAIGIARPLSILNDGRIGYQSEKEGDTGRWIGGGTVEIPIPIFDGGQAARFGAEARYRQALAQHDALVVMVRSEVRVAALQLAAARKRAEAYRTRIIPLRHRAVEETQRLSNAMAVSVFVVLQAKQSEIEAGQGYIEAVRDYWDARAQLERVAGGTLPSTAMAAAVPMPSDSLPPIDLLRDARFVTAADTAPPAPGDTAGMPGMKMAPGQSMSPGMKMAPGHSMSPGMKMESAAKKEGTRMTPGMKTTPGMKMTAPPTHAPSGTTRPPTKQAPAKPKMAPGMKMSPEPKMDPAMKMPPPKKKMDPGMKMPGMTMPER